MSELDFIQKISKIFILVGASKPLPLSAPGRARRQVRRAALSSYLRWVLRLLSVAPDEAVIEEIAQQPDEGCGPSIEMNYMATLDRKISDSSHFIPNSDSLKYFIPLFWTEFNGPHCLLVMDDDLL